jgi:molybdopterin synthase sulfur carrier subunit
MPVRVLFFGAIADIVGKRELETGSASSSQLLETLTQEYTPLASHKLLVAVNQEYINGDVAINNGDEVAIFTPVSGG